MEITSIFITGLFVGGLSCLAVQGGLLASSITQQEKNRLEHEAKDSSHMVPIFSFLITRLIAYTLLGLLLGSLGEVVQLTLSARVVLQFVAATFMLGTAMNLLDIHPIFRYFAIQPPRFLTRLVKNQSRSKSVFGPALLGASTVLIPCGATQAMMAYAVSTGSAINGATTMFVFILGTSPLFFSLGYVAKKMGSNLSANFNKIAAAAIILVAFYNLSGALALAGVNLDPKNILAKEASVEVKSAEVVNEATIYFTQDGYELDPEVVNFKSGSKVKIKLVNQDGSGCIQAFTIPKLGIQRIVPVGSSGEIVFKAPNSSGTLLFMCSMGMFRGSINII